MGRDGGSMHAASKEPSAGERRDLMLGHSSITVTADDYSHLIGEVGRLTAEAGAAQVPRRSQAVG